jgi:hypothetical protein
LAPFIEILQLSFCVMNYAHLVYEMQMASAAWAWMYRQPQEDWENLLSGVNSFLNQAEANMRNHGVQAMLCPCIDCLNQKKFTQREIIFHHLVTRGFTKSYTYWNKHGEEGLNELEQAASIKVKCDTMLTMMKTLMTVDFLREMNHYSHQMC